MFIGIGGQNILLISKYNIWLSILIGFIIGFIPISIIAYLNKKDINLFDLINNNFNKYIAKTLNIIIILVLFFTLVTLTNDLVNFANVKYLFETPNLIITILFIVPAVYICHKGIETIGRSALFLFFIDVIIFFINSISLIGNIELNNLKPFLSEGFIPILKGSLYYVIYAVVPIFIIGIIPKNKDIDVKKYNKSLIFGYIVGSIAIFTITFYVTTIYNYEYIKLFSYPTYYTLKKIGYGFIQNVENILSFYFIIDYFFSVLTLLYGMFYFLSKEINLKGKKLNIAVIIVTVLLVYLSNYLFKDTTIALLSSKSTYIIMGSIFITLYIFILPFIIKLKTKQKSA